MKRTDTPSDITAKIPGYFQSEASEKRENSQKNDQLTITVVFNNISKENHLTSAWGFGAWIEDNNGAVLFDTGSDGKILLENITSAGLDLTRLHTIVISHEHWDHVNGLPEIVSKLRRQVSVFVPSGTEKKIRELVPGSDVVPVTGPQCITGEIWSTGPLHGDHKGYEVGEQALLINKGGKSYIITGCSHPGIENIVSVAAKHFPDNEIALVAGGFHMDDFSENEIRAVISKLEELKVHKVAPSHCTGERAIELYYDHWKDNLVDLRLGESFVTV